MVPPDERPPRAGRKRKKNEADYGMQHESGCAMIATLKDIDLSIIEAAGGHTGGTVPAVAEAAEAYRVLRLEILAERNVIDARRNDGVNGAADRPADSANDDVALADELDARELRAIRRELVEVVPAKQTLRSLCAANFETHKANLTEEMNKRIAHIEKQADKLDVASDPLVQGDSTVQRIRAGLRHFEAVRRGLGEGLLDDEEKARLESLRLRAKAIMARRLGLVLPTPPRVKETFV